LGNGPTGGGDDSFYVAVDNSSSGSGTQANVCSAEVSCTTASDGFGWKAANSTLSISSGTHSFYVKFREPNARVDKILLTKATTTPTGLGGTALGCGAGATFTPTRTATPVPPTATRTATPLAATATRTPTALPATATRTPTAAPPTATRTSTPLAASATPTAGSATYPSQILDLTNWKITLPIDSSGGTSGTAMEVKQPALATYSINPYFIVNGSGVQFRAPTNGATTSGSSYPRSELREMTSNGTTNASWSTTSGTHTMVIDQAITTVPNTKRHIVAGQIHDANDDVLTVRLEYPKLFVDHNGVAGPTITSNYVLGTRFTVKFVASGGAIKVYYNGSSTPVDTYTISSSGDYFKAGAYTQANCSTETACGPSDYGEVVIYGLTVTHQ
jgi:hypothetical protein